MIDLTSKNIVVTGGNGFLGSYVVKKLKQQGCKHVFVPGSKEYDLRIKENCEKVVKGKDIIIHLAAKVGGIGLNLSKPGELFFDNSIMGIQLMEEARKAKTEKFIALGTICAYPKYTDIPFKEEDLWKGYPEETNAPYGLAKKILLVQAQAYRKQYGFNAIFLLPINLYGPGDKFDLPSAHVIPAIIHRVHEAKKEGKDHIILWGDGTPTRDFLYVEECADAIISATSRYDSSAPVNLGGGMEISIKNLAEKICELMDFQGEIRWDTSKPNGQPRRCLNTEKAEKEFGFKAKMSLDEGLGKTIDWYNRNFRF